MTIKAIFLDRDGVINREKNYLFKIEDFEFIDGIFDACRHLSKIGYSIIVVTNQSGISRGYYTELDFLNLNKWMIKQFNTNDINILDIFYCPHLPEANCRCRKPKPGMLLKAQEKHNISMKKSWFIGDKEDDISAANRAGINKTILVKSGHKIDQRITKAKFILRSIKDSQKIILT